MNSVFSDMQCPFYPEKLKGLPNHTGTIEWPLIYSRESNSYRFDTSVILEPKLSSSQNKSPLPSKRLYRRRSDGPLPVIRHHPSQNDSIFTLYFRVDCGLFKRVRRLVVKESSSIETLIAHQRFFLTIFLTK